MGTATTVVGPLIVIVRTIFICTHVGIVIRAGWLRMSVTIVDRIGSMIIRADSVSVGAGSVVYRAGSRITRVCIIVVRAGSLVFSVSAPVMGISLVKAIIVETRTLHILRTILRVIVSSVRVISLTVSLLRNISGVSVTLSYKLFRTVMVLPESLSYTMAIVSMTESLPTMLVRLITELPVKLILRHSSIISLVMTVINTVVSSQIMSILVFISTGIMSTARYS